MAFVSLATGSTNVTTEVALIALIGAAVALVAATVVLAVHAVRMRRLLKNGRRCPDRAPLISRRRLELSSATRAPWSATTIEIRGPLGNPERNGNEPCGKRLEELLGELERR